MTTSTTRPTGTAEAESPTVDIETMRATAHRLLAEDADLPMPKELKTLTLQLRGHIMRAVPEVETAAEKLPETAAPRACALVCIGEARMRLSTEPRPALPAGIAHAQQLARSVNALCDHLETLSGETTTLHVCRYCDGLILDPEDAVRVASEHGSTGPGWEVWARREHAHLVRPDPRSAALLARIRALRAAHPES